MRRSPVGFTEAITIDTSGRSGPAVAIPSLNYCSKNLNAHSRTSSISHVKENPHNEPMEGHNCAEECLKGSPYFRFSMLYSARRALKLKNTFNYGFRSYRADPARLRSTIDSKGFVSSWQRCWVMMICLIHSKSAQTLFQDLNHELPLPNPVLHAHRPCWPEQWESCTLWMSVEIRKNKTLWLFKPSLTFLTFQITFLSHELMYCTGELLREWKGDFPLSIIVSRPTSSLIH